MAIAKKEFHIDGMHCGSCAIGIQMILSHQDSIKNVSVSYEDKSGEIEHNDQKTNVEGIEKMISRAYPKTRFWVRGSGFLRRDEGVDDETYRRYVESELRVAAKNPLPQSEWGFRTCSQLGYKATPK